MLPNMCSQPPCMNMAVKIVRKFPSGLVNRWRGTTDQRSMNATPLVSSTKKTAKFNRIKRYLTTGVDLREELSSLMGIIMNLLMAKANSVFLFSMLWQPPCFYCLQLYIKYSTPVNFYFAVLFPQP